MFEGNMRLQNCFRNLRLDDVLTPKSNTFILTPPIDSVSIARLFSQPVSSLTAGGLTHLSKAETLLL